ncbi:MAG: carboxylesterase/lipase family protein [Firmicutes bacterium]|nr:carboxylesterase/lipase family protein [Bacillota bacterium]
MRTFHYDGEPVIETSSGLIKGYALGDIHIFKGIPYARAERFQMPVPVHWEGVRQCASYGYVCHLLEESEPHGELRCPHMYWPQDENCLNLNIWTPSLTEGAGKPVMVWLHGGGYAAGSSIEQLAYDGLRLAENGDLVVVSINHRLNIFGYLDASVLGEGYENSGNAGTADLVAALRWVQQNIRKFGGDPRNVTIFGQSGGGMKVTDLMNIPAADGLYAKAFAMSGVADEGISSIIKENQPGRGGDELVRAMAKDLGCTELRELTSVPAKALIASYLKVRPEYEKEYFAGTPYPNDWYRGWPSTKGFRKEVKDIPLLIGTVFGEFGTPAAIDREKPLSREHLGKELQKLCGKNSEAIKEEFRKLYPEKDVYDVLYYDRVFRCPTLTTARNLTKIGGKAYVYLFAHNYDYQQHIPAWHCSDIPLVFGNAEIIDYCQNEEAYALQEKVFAAVTSFARHGDPNNALLPQWPAASPQEVPTMIIDNEWRLLAKSDEKLIALLDEVSERMNLSLFASNDVQH